MPPLWSHLDFFVNDLAVFMATPVTLRIAAWISIVSDVEAVLVITLVLVAYFIYYKRWHDVLVITIATGFTVTLVSFLKDFCMVARPNVLYQIISGSYSFPSGHASTAAAFFTSLILIYTPHLSSKQKKKTFIFVCVAAIVLVGLSRLVLNVHWLSDVVIGWTLGFAIAYFADKVVRKVVK